MTTQLPSVTHQIRHRARGWLVASIAGLAVCSAGTLVAAGQPLGNSEMSMKIRISVGGETATATLDDNATARDFAALLPLSLTLENYAGVERIATLPRKLSLAGAPAGTTPRSGELHYYAPWNNLAVFVGGDVYARGLVRLGTVNTGLPALQRPGPLKVRIERIGD